jgi:hypothetical protein
MQEQLQLRRPRREAQRANPRTGHRDSRRLTHPNADQRVEPSRLRHARAQGAHPPEAMQGQLQLRRPRRKAQRANQPVTLTAAIRQDPERWKTAPQLPPHLQNAVRRATPHSHQPHPHAWELRPTWHIRRTRAPRRPGHAPAAGQGRAGTRYADAPRGRSGWWRRGRSPSRCRARPNGRTGAR